MGVAFIQLERLDSAIVYCRQAVNLAPKYENAIINLGLAFHANGQYDSSINYFLKAIQIEPTRGRTYFRVACSYTLNKNIEQAISYLKLAYEKGYKNKDALLSDPDLIDLYNVKAYQDLLDKYVPDWRNR
ncbi:MAG: tetratricopeptide repeat protein [Chitinophagaceae bacterium]|nr:tetratricopeptide repeat protein [Chitinophagaceae bacterium]